jgi:hypothetical protein
MLRVFAQVPLTKKFLFMGGIGLLSSVHLLVRNCEIPGAVMSRYFKETTAS